MSDIMKKIKHAEMSSVADKAPSKEKPQASMMKKYKQGEFSDAGGKSSKAGLDSSIMKKYTHGEFSKA